MISISPQIKGDVYELKLAGRLDVKAAKEAETAFSEAASKETDIVLDMTELDYIASAGLRALKRLSSDLRTHGNSLTLRGTQPYVMEVFEMTGFAAILHFE